MVVNMVNLETNIDIIKDPEIFLHVCVMYIRYMNECSTHTLRRVIIYPVYR